MLFRNSKSFAFACFENHEDFQNKQIVDLLFLIKHAYLVAHWTCARKAYKQEPDAL
jgi:hypothetical protein